MKKLNGKLKHNIAVFLSGRGSNLKSIIKYSLRKEKFYKVKLKENSKKTLVLSNLDPKIHIKIDKKTSSAIVNLDNNLFSLKCKKYLFRM